MVKNYCPYSLVVDNDKVFSVDVVKVRCFMEFRSFLFYKNRSGGDVVITHTKETLPLRYDYEKNYSFFN